MPCPNVPAYSFLHTLAIIYTQYFIKRACFLTILITSSPFSLSLSPCLYMSDLFLTSFFYQFQRSIFTSILFTHLHFSFVYYCDYIELVDYEPLDFTFTLLEINDVSILFISEVK